MVDAGMLTLEEAANHPNASVLERAVGSQPNVEVEISTELKIEDGDAILLCSDGLSGYATDPEIATILRSPASVQEVPEHLVRLALQKGGEDNVTVQFIQYGTRKEALTEPKQPQEPKPITPQKRHTLLSTAAFLLLFGVICAGLYFYFERKLVNTKIQMLEVQKIAARNSQKMIEQVSNFAARILELQIQLAELKKNSESSTDTLTKELQETTASRNKASKLAKGFQQKFRTANAARDKAEKRAKELAQQLSAAKAGKAAAETEADGLRTKLDEANKELSELKSKQAKVPEGEENSQPTNQSKKP